ncbi:hypothetical protein B4127_1504 [Bacillus pumilus]|uniref:Lipoprotein n=1 Tax=Bacillus pumilus TaxID=1408 RepID=A0AB34QNW3_BACPU|nr:hypothetical protein [Bacillus pumilus]KIL12173.1 hypothetical protein B4127_1504 [Bacillus pumilus]
MKKKLLFIFLTFLFTLVSCSSESVKSDSPDYIKESFDYFISIKSLVKSVNDGEEVDKAVKSNFEKQSEFNEWIDTNYDPNDEPSEEAVLISHFHLIKTLLENLVIFSASKSLGVEDVDISSPISSLENSLSNLESIYEEYGYEPKD